MALDVYENTSPIPSAKQLMCVDSRKIRAKQHEDALLLVCMKNNNELKRERRVRKGKIQSLYVLIHNNKRAIVAPNGCRLSRVLSWGWRFPAIFPSLNQYRLVILLTGIS